MRDFGWIVATGVALILAGVIWANGTIYGQMVAYQKELQMVKAEFKETSDRRLALALKCAK